MWYRIFIKGRYTKRLNMRKSNSLALNQAKNFLRIDILLNTKGQYMKDSNFLVSNVAKNFYLMVML